MDFFWAMGIRPLELRGPPRLVQTLPNNNGIDEIINGPSGQVTPVTRPPFTSPKFDWKPKMTKMRHVCTLYDKLEADRSTNFWWPMGVRPLELRGPILEPQAASTNNGMDAIVTGLRVEMAPHRDRGLAPYRSYVQ